MKQALDSKGRAHHPSCEEVNPTKPELPELKEPDDE